MAKAIVLLSGGLDSLTCTAYALHQGWEVHAISFHYAQKISSELSAAQHIAEHYGISHRVINLQDLGKMGGSALTDNSIAVEDYQDSEEIPSTYVPARNIVFLSIALGYAEVLGAERIIIGANAVDYSGYPDCRPEFMAAFQAMASQGTKAGIEGHGIQLETPLIHLTKAEIIQLGVSLGVDYSMSVSCYRADAKGLACGTCDSCHYRQKGFAEAGIPDPTRYQE